MSTHKIVGAHFRPPAKTLLEVIAVGTPLALRAEPTNAFDANAIMVLLRGADIPSDLPGLDEALAGSGTSLRDVRAEGEHHVGYIPREDAAALRAQGFPEGRDIAAQFSCSAAGAPLVRFNPDW